MSDEAGEDHDAFGPISWQPLSRIMQIGGARLADAWSRIPHVTHFDNADVTQLEGERGRWNGAGARPSMLAWIARATVLALREHPRFCATLDEAGRRIALKRYLNLGIAVDSPAGLLVGVIRDANELDVDQLGDAIRDLAERGRAGKLKPSEMEGGCFTISSLGNLGGTGFTPIINSPEVAILGVCPARWQPIVVGDVIEKRLMLPLSLSYDHRVLNGADAARFSTTLAELLAAPTRLLQG
ncbi:MAG: 2-oxo acid dehydrogenase subunit E2 [Steroidobacteraceae bacterium]